MDIYPISVTIFLSLFKVIDFSISGQVRLWWQVWWCPFLWETQWSEVETWALLPEQKFAIFLLGQPPHPYSSSAVKVRSSFSDILKRRIMYQTEQIMVSCALCARCKATVRVSFSLILWDWTSDPCTSKPWISSLVLWSWARPAGTTPCSQLLWKSADWEEWRSWVLSNSESERPSGPHF